MKILDSINEDNITEYSEQREIGSLGINRRKFLATLSVVGIGGVAGCSDIYVPDEFDTYNSEMELRPNNALSNVLTGPRACELEYSLEVESSDEGFEEEATADILIMTESSYQKSDVMEIGPQSSLIESPSRFNVSDSIEVSGRLDAGLYRIVGRNQGSSRSLTASIDATLQSYESDRDESDCDSSSSGLEVRHLEVFHDPEGIVEQRVLLYHIIAHDATDGEYEMSMTLMTDKQETSVSATEESDVCETHFVHYGDTELDVNDGFFERNEEVRAQITITQDGSTIAETEVIFTPTIVDYDE